MEAKIKRLFYHTGLGGWLSIPLIYILIIPFSFMDLTVTIYQHACFRLWGLARVRRGEHVIFDRNHLPHMNWRERLNCMYCDYAQGVIAYVSAVTHQTEHFWCPVKHKTNIHGQSGAYEGYIGRDDTAGYRDKLWGERAKCRACKRQDDCGEK